MAEIVGKSSSINSIKRGRCTDLLKLLPISYLYWNGYIEAINDTNEVAHLDKNNGISIIKDDINKFQNNLTEDARGKHQK